MVRVREKPAVGSKYPVLPILFLYCTLPESPALVTSVAAVGKKPVCQLAQFPNAASETKVGRK